MWPLSDTCDLLVTHVTSPWHVWLLSDTCDIWFLQYIRTNIYISFIGTATGIQLLRMYTDPAEDECFYSLSWSYDKDIPVIAVAGKRAVIRIIYPTNPGYSSAELVSWCGYSLVIWYYLPKAKYTLNDFSKRHRLYQRLCLKSAGTRVHTHDVTSADNSQYIVNNK